MDQVDFEVGIAGSIFAIVERSFHRKIPLPSI